MINVIIVDDHPYYIEGVKKSLDPHRDKIMVTATAFTLEETRNKLNDDFDVILLDLMLKNESGIDFILELVKHYPQLKIMALTGETDPDVLYKAFKNGAHSIMMKYCEHDELTKAIKDIHDGERVIGKNVPPFLYKMDETEKKTGSLLTPREHEVLTFLACGHTRKKTADLMNISLDGVDFHCKKIYKKLGYNKLHKVIEEAKKRKIIG